MGLWTLLLLHFHLAVCVSLPAPSNVSISSYNMEHILRFSPGPGTPPDALFTVQIYSSRRQRWKAVAGCQELTAGQMCNLTDKLKDVLDHYMAQVRASRTNQTSQWTKSREFQPLTDTVLGPPDFYVSGCGNCLILQIRDSSWSRFDHNVQLKNLYWEVEFNVKRTRDGAETEAALRAEERDLPPAARRGVLRLRLLHVHPEPQRRLQRTPLRLHQSSSAPTHLVAGPRPRRGVFSCAGPGRVSGHLQK
ncbi:interferon alpha/beta receptor 2-like isoform 4-T5 [Fundulus diaphanus]